MKIKDQKRKSIVGLIGGSFFLAVVMLVFITRGLYAEDIGGDIKQLLTKDMEGAEYVGTETCATCHDKQNKEFKLSAHARFTISEDTEGVAQGCEVCHGPGSIHVENGGGRGTMINPRNKPEMCFTCHLDKKAEFRLPYRHPVLEGHMSCSDCHNVHGVDARPWTATSMEDVNGACFKCHKDKQGPFPWEHGALREGCTTCHRVHGAITDKMLVARDANLCLRCHIQSDFTTIGARNHGSASGNSDSNLSQATCWSSGCHTAIHGSYFDRHYRE